MNSKSAESWHKIEIFNAGQYSELISSFLIDLGSVGLQEIENNLLIFFPGSTDSKSVQIEIQAFLERLKKELNLTTKFEIVISKVESENWQRNWMQYFKPIFVENKLIITPSWERVAPENGEIIITIDPEQAFGTGGHATTYLMLKLLVKYCQPGMRILDVGTGSGILTIAAIKLGGEHAVAFDMDPIAVKTARKNSEINGVSRQINFFSGEIFALRPELKLYDFILANISAGVFQNLLPRFSRFLHNSNSFLALSGILKAEAKSISCLLNDYRFKVLEHLEKEDWVGFLCQQKRS